MAKLTRVTNKIFADSAVANEIGQFGSVVAGSKLETGDVETIQALTAWLTGCSEALVSGNRYISLQEFNGFGKVITYQQAYQAQEGIAEYDSATTYYIGSIVKKTGTFELYGSLTDDNLGNALSSATNWKLLVDLNSIVFADEDLSNITNAGKNVITNNVMPDYSAGVSKTWNTSYTATVDGWIKLYLFSSDSTTAILLIDGTNAQQYRAGNADVGIVIWTPIAKDSTYSTSGGGSGCTITFYPAKGAS